MTRNQKRIKRELSELNSVKDLKKSHLEKAQGSNSDKKSKVIGTFADK